MGAGELAAIAALGNPGAEYQMTRHNVGFWVADALTARSGVRFRSGRKLNGDVARVTIANQPVPVFKPMTFMNESGRAVGAFCAYQKLNVEGLLVVHDDLDLPVGTVRLKRGGGHGGHNGLRDIMAHIGADFMRMRIGIGRPPPDMDAIRYVLSRAGSEEESRLLESVETVLGTLPLLIEKGLESAMQSLHTPRPHPESIAEGGHPPPHPGRTR
ncbi:MAG: aminoacyl-tRNA hydrolase [Gammaproteobacteria bacterium]